MLVTERGFRIIFFNFISTFLELDLTEQELYLMNFFEVKVGVFLMNFSNCSLASAADFAMVEFYSI